MMRVRFRVPCLIGALALVLFAAVFLAPSVACATQDGHPVVVSMGDSYSSGEGVEPFIDQGRTDKYNSLDWLAHRSEKGWPGLLKVQGQTLNEMPEGWYYVAASGAVTAHILGGAHDTDAVGQFTKRWKGWDSVFPEGEGSNTLPCQDDQLRALQGSVDYVTLTMGGNDVGFGDIVGAAATNDLKDVPVVRDLPIVSVGNLDAELQAALKKFHEQTRFDLIDTYKQIQRNAGSQAHVIVAGYPHLFPADGRSALVKIGNASLATPSEVVGVSADDAGIINSSVDVFDGPDRILYDCHL